MRPLSEARTRIDIRIRKFLIPKGEAERIKFLCWGCWKEMAI
jgi:hypothetical protein